MVGAPNLLPLDGVVTLLPELASAGESMEWFEALQHETPWKSDEIVMFGKRITTTRKVAWYGDADCAYRYSGVTKEPLPWTETLFEIKIAVESASDESYNCCLLNLYHHGGEGMGWHSDDEKELEPNAAIASVSLGAERKFVFKHRRNPELKVETLLPHGSLLIMAGETQRHWLHALPKSVKVKSPRINLTFRRMRDLA